MSRPLPAGQPSSSLRRELGPVAWCALECLRERSEDGGRTAVASVRSVAAELGVAKNTAHRALAAIARCGLIEAAQARDESGRFRPGLYRLRVDELLADGVFARRPASPPQPSRQRKTPIAPEQLTLIPDS